ncbi:hypothetical protein FRB97_007561 [Tulasnella sp. 331]|nr:hypothetical protein FRB97_007561 [Tulasnella sp. 331]
MISRISVFFGFTLFLTSVSAGVVRPRGRAIPDFYLISVTTDPSANLKPLGQGPDGSAELVGGSVGPLYLDGGHLIFDGGNTAYIDYLPTELSGCSTSGKLMFGSIDPSNSCAKAVGFGLQSDHQNSQLGAELIFTEGPKFSVCPDGSLRERPDTELHIN